MPSEVSVLLLMLALGASPTAHAADLIVDGTTTVLSGTVSYDAVEVINGGQIVVADYDGSLGTGILQLTADSILVDATSSIVANGAGYRGILDAAGEGPGGGQGGTCCEDSGGGGAHGGDGGDGSRDNDCGTLDGLGGAAYGDPTSLDIDMGSAGGAAGVADADPGGPGGDGGGAIWLVAETIIIDGTLSADGSAGGVYSNDAAGGGAGGGILLQANILDCDGLLLARGGTGGNIDDDGGSGGGGVIKQFWDASGITCSVDLSPGLGECGANPGVSGASAEDDADWDGDGYTTAEGDCASDDPSLSPDTWWYPDTDGDGFGDPDAGIQICEPPSGYTLDASDCDDDAATAFPGGEELCDGLDNDCDGTVDEADATDAPTWYADTDGDGFGDPDASVVSCDAPSGTVADPTDCDDSTSAVNPDATELCNGVDDDCDGTIDEDDAADAPTWYADTDGDGFGDPDAPVVSCDAPSGTVADATDCDDGDLTAYPGAPELCDGVDDDCDGTIDEGALDAPTWYADTDGDGFGDPGTGLASCEPPTGYVADATDCDDADGATYPGAPELCDGMDDDCDGVADEDALDAPTWYADTDGDGFGDPGAGLAVCDRPSGYVADATDCDDSTPTVNPAAPELCNGVDDDCDGTIDEDDALDASTWYADTDGDGYGDAGAPIVSCDAPAGAVVDATDCDDTDAATFPGAPETCDGADDDCDGAIDEGASDALTWYTDADGDGFGDPGTAVEECTAPSGTVATAGDCDDADPTSFPGGTEVCDGADNDCNGTVDDGAVDDAIWYVDADGDGFGDPGTGLEICTPPTGYVADDTDCDDADVAVNPGAIELCNGVDDDCDGTVDEGDAADATAWYSDSDGDGYGDPAVFERSCSPISGAVADATDCDDTDPAVNPGETEIWYDGTDQDCDGNDDDQDLDGYPWDGVKGGTDCDDTDPDTHPDADDPWYDGIDSNCDGADDYDADGDGHASASYGGDDCDDADPDVYPGAPDEPYDGVITDCDDSDEYDADGDGHDAEAYGGDDCDDARSDVHPGSDEIWYDGADQDCDGNDDDQDEDGFAVDVDCDDTDPDLYPNAPGLDEDCEELTGDTAEPEDTGSVDTAIVDTATAGKYLGGCGGCAGAPGGAGGWAALALAAIALRRRRN